MSHFELVYPNEQTISEKKMRQWAEDAIANGEIDGPATLGTVDLAQQMEDAGLITLAHDLPM